MTAPTINDTDTTAIEGDTATLAIVPDNELPPSFKVAFLAESMLPALAHAKAVLPRRSALPIVNTLRITTGLGQLRIEATDLDVWLRQYVGAKIEVEGSVCVNAAEFTTAIPKGSTAYVEVRGRTMFIDAGGTHSEIPLAFDAADYPKHPEIKAEASFDIDAWELAEALTYATPCMAPDDSRPVLAGTLFEAADDVVTLTAADGFRLANRTLQTVRHYGPAATAIVGGSGLKVATKMLTKLAKPGRNRKLGNVYIRLSHEWASIHIGEFDSLAIRVVQGTFPTYTQLIPDPANDLTKWRVNSAELGVAVKEASAVAKFGSDIVRLNSVGPKLHVSAKATNDQGKEVSFSRTVTLLESAADVHIAFSYHYLSEALAVAGENVTIGLTLPSAPARFDACDGKGTTVVMPMFVQW